MSAQWFLHRTPSQRRLDVTIIERRTGTLVLETPASYTSRGALADLSRGDGASDRGRGSPPYSTASVNIYT